MTGLVITVAVAAVAALGAAAALRMRGGRGTPASATPAAPVPDAEFHVHDDTATVSFDVPLPDDDVDDVLRDLLLHQAVDVVREKRHHLPIDDVTRVVVRGRRAGDWAEVGSVSLETPGELPLLEPPELIPGLHEGHTLDLFDHASNLPEHAPGLADATGTDTLGPLGPELAIPAAIAAGLRSQGIDPSTSEAGDIVLGILRITGATVTEETPGTYLAAIGGRSTMIRVVPHLPGEHPELEDAEVRRFAAEAASSKAEQALLITEKFSPFEVYERERRDPRARYITRERVQHFIDALALR